MKGLVFDPREKTPIALIVNEYNSDYLIKRASEELFLGGTSKTRVILATRLLVAALAKNE